MLHLSVNFDIRNNKYLPCDPGKTTPTQYQKFASEVKNMILPKMWSCIHIDSIQHGLSKIISYTILTF